MTGTIQFTMDKLDRLIERYDLAVENGEEQFEFEGHDFLTDYAKYLIQYLRGEFGLDED